MKSTAKLHQLALSIFCTIAILILSYSCDKSNEGEKPIQNRAPVVKTAEVYDIRYTEAKVNAKIESDGGASITEKGICWSLNPNPTLNDTRIASTSAGNQFSCTINNLKKNTSYHVRAYATNSAGVGYGEDISLKTLEENVLPASVSPLMSSKWTVFTWPYNAFYPNYQGGNNIKGKYPAPCGSTALARLLGFWRGQIKGSGIVDAMNTWGEVRFTCKLDTLNINYNNTPNSFGSNPSENEYKDVAKIFLMAGAVGLTNKMDVGTPDDSFINGLKKYFNVSNEIRLAKRWEYSKEEWIKLLKTELANGHPLMIAARTSDSPAPGSPGSIKGHWFNIEGYNSEDKFYIDYNYAGNGFRGYYNIDALGEYNSYGIVVVGFYPSK